MGRIVAEGFANALGQTVIVDNRGGAGGTARTRQALAAEPDGYTLSSTTRSTQITWPLLFPNPGHDGVSDVAAIGAFAQVGSIAEVHPSLPANNIAELFAYCRANPGRLNFASAGAVR